MPVGICPEARGRGRGGAWTCPVPAPSFQARNLAWNRGIRELLAASPPASRAGPGPGSSPQPPFSIRQRTNTAHQRHAADPHELQTAHLAVTPPPRTEASNTWAAPQVDSPCGCKMGPPAWGSSVPGRAVFRPSPIRAPLPQEQCQPAWRLGEGQVAEI